MFKKMLILECLGCFTKSIVVSMLNLFDTSLFRKMLKLSTCKIITFESRASYGEFFYLREFVTWQVCEMLSDISLGGVFTLLLQHHFGCHVLINLKLINMAFG